MKTIKFSIVLIIVLAEIANCQQPVKEDCPLNKYGKDKSGIVYGEYGAPCRNSSACCYGYKCRDNFCNFAQCKISRKNKNKKDPITGIIFGENGSTCTKDSDCCTSIVTQELRRVKGVSTADKCNEGICGDIGKRKIQERVVMQLGCGRGKDANGREIGGIGQPCKTYADCCFEYCSDATKTCGFNEGCGSGGAIGPSGDYLGMPPGSFGSKCETNFNCCSDNCVEGKCAQPKGCASKDGRSPQTGQPYGAIRRVCASDSECCSSCTQNTCGRF